MDFIRSAGGDGFIQSNTAKTAQTYSIHQETKQPLHKQMAQPRRASSSGQDSAVHLHLKDKGHSFEDCNVCILAREDRWFEKWVKEAIFVNQEKTSLNRGGGLIHQLSATSSIVLSSPDSSTPNHTPTPVTLVTHTIAGSVDKLQVSTVFQTLNQRTQKTHNWLGGHQPACLT